VLTDANGHIRLTDFGLSKEHFEEGQAMSECFPPPYRLPPVRLSLSPPLSLAYFLLVFTVCWELRSAGVHAHP
jgi:hypothetical protein